MDNLVVNNKISSLRLDYMDTSQDPKENFYDYANGKWSGLNPIPDEYPRWGTFMILNDDVLHDLRKICENCVDIHEDPKESNAMKIGQFWSAAMNEEMIEMNDLEPLREIFDSIDGVSSVMEFTKLVGDLHAKGISLLFSCDLIPDFKDSSMERLIIQQGGLGLPNRDYYVDDSKEEIRQKYTVHIQKMFELYGCSESEATEISKTIFNLEKDLALVSRTPTAMRDIASLYNPYTHDQLHEGKWSWSLYFETLEYNVALSPFVILATPEFFDHIGKVIHEDNLTEWQLYLKWHVLHSVANYLPQRFVEEHFQLKKIITGVEKEQPRWKRVVATMNDYCGELLGEVYCRQHFTPKSKEKCIDLVERLRNALAKTVTNLEWMSPETKEMALEKLKAFGVKIGYPDKWIDYTSLEFTDTSYISNILRTNAFHHKIDMQRVDHPVESHRWELPPQTVNAYYHPMKNEIVFPAAILQPPAFDIERDDAMNYGAIGAVIGHEMTHGFDDQGRLFDAAGNMKEWWEPMDVEKFNSLASKAIHQYGKIKLHGQNINGELTQGENIADVGGVKIAHAALLDLYEEQGDPKEIDGFTGEQRFFLSWAQFWASACRETEALRLLSVDPHSPSDIRAVQPLRNVEAFHQAFHIESNHAMYLDPNERITIWG